MEESKPVTQGRLNSLHDLVLDYISHNAFAATARVLSQPRPRRTTTSSSAGNGVIVPDGDVQMDESEGVGNGTVRNGENGGVEGAENGAQKDRIRERLFTESELDSIERRRVIINHILNGSIVRAVGLIDTCFPAVLDDTTPAPHAGESSSKGRRSSKTGTSSMTPDGIAPGSVNHSVPTLVHSTVPAHVKLNLQIQAFIESFRNLAPSSPSSPSSSVSSLASSMHISTHDLGSLPRPTNGSSNGKSSWEKTAVTLTNALTAAQALHAEAKKLPPDVRAVYLQEIKDVGALFAYDNPETSILGGLLVQDRRIALADQVNAAILASEDRSGPAFLHSIAQRTGAIYSLMSSRGIDPRPAGYDDRSAKKDQLSRYWKNQTGERYRFDLHDFTELAWH